MTYQPGQMVWVRRLSWLPGVIVQKLPMPCPLTGSGALYEVEIQDDGISRLVNAHNAKHCACACFLRPRHDDGRELVAWKDCLWRPKTNEKV